MLRKLILAVLVISLALAFVGTALSDTRTPTANIRTLPAVADRLDNKIQLSGDPVAIGRAMDVTPMGVDVPYPTPYAPDHECEILDLADYAGSFYSFPVYGDDGYGFGNRFEVQPFHQAEVYGFAIRYYTITNNAGGVDLVVNVHEDNAGEPGTVIYTETIPAADLIAAGPGHRLFSFAAPVTVTSGIYYITYTAVGDATDYISIGLNVNADGTDNGAGVFYAGGWMTLSDAFGEPMNLRLSSDVCYVNYTDCYTVHSGLSHYIPIPLQGFTDGDWTGWGQRFEVGNDTLKEAHLYFYIHPNTAYQAYVGTNETNGVTIEVWPDDGAGNIDASAGIPLATRSIAGGVANMFPTSQEDRSIGGSFVEHHVIDFSADNLVMRGFFHVTARMTSADPADGQVYILMEDFGIGGSCGFTVTPWAMNYSNNSWLNELWGNDAAAYFGVTMCKDEFQSCETQILHAGDFASAFTAGGNLWEFAQQVDGSPLGNRVEAIRFQVADETPWGGGPDDNGNPSLAVNIYTQTIDAYGDFTPGALVYADTIGEPVYWPGWNEVVIPDVMLFGDFWVGYELITDDPANNWFNANMDLGPYDVNSGAWTFYLPWGEWIHTNLFSGIDFNNWFIDVDFCEVPVPARPCDGNDWSTLQNDFTRAGAGGVGIGDAQCNLTFNWEYDHPTLVSQYVGPVIFDGKLITTFRSTGGSQYVVFDLATNTQLYTISVGGNVTAIPTAAHIAYNDKDMLFITGGNNLIAAGYDLDAGTLIWDIHAGDLPGMGTGETNAMGNFIIDGNGILYFTTNIGKVYCVWADDGLQWGGIWPVNYYQIAAPGPTASRTGCFDGENLYYGYSTILGGDIASVSSADGSENWTLTSADGLKAFETWGPGATVEQFAGGISVDPEEGALFAVSTLASNVYPQTAVFYKINTSSGMAEEYEQCNGFNWPCTPVIDMNHVYVQFSPSGGYWINQVNQGMQVQAFRKDNGDYDWGIRFGEDNSIDFTSAEMLLTCEEGPATDLLFLFGRDGGLHCIDTDNRIELYSRHITDVVFGGAAGAIGKDIDGVAHLVYQTALGRVIDMVAAEDARPRLELLGNNFQAPVPFGTADPYTVTFTEVIENSGCADLEVDVTILEASNGAPAHPVSMIRPGLEADAAALADELTPGKDFARMEDLPELISKDQISREAVNPSALALYSWIKNPTFHLTLAAGDVSDIDIDVVQNDVGRGVFTVYAQFESNDPDYWLDPALMPPPPEVSFDFLGGCVVEWVEMPFGLGLVNNEFVYNSGRMGQSDYGTFTWDGNAGAFFQGAYIHGVNDTTLSLSTIDWSGGDETDAYRSWLPETYMGECVPLLLEAQSLAGWSDDGVTYTPVMANVVFNNSIDSVQYMGDGLGGWDWTATTSPYDNDMTMGLLFHHQTIGPYDFGTIVDLLGNASIEIFTVEERNGDPVTGWVMGNYIDFDINNPDTTDADFAISGGWAYSKTASGARDCMGQIKIPFGCGYEPMLNVWQINQDSGMWTDVPWLYDAYHNMHDSVGNLSQGPATGQDGAAAFTSVKHDFAGGDTFEFATATFWMYDNPFTNLEIARMAHQLNKFMGFGRGDVNNDNAINLADIVYLANYVNYSGPGPIPFEHLGDVDADTDIDLADAMYLVAYYFDCGPCPLGAMMNKL